jgi:methionyl-tRNA formyltransferase
VQVREVVKTDGIGPRVVCIGANEESRVSLAGLLEDGANVVGLVTLAPRSSNAGSDYVDLHPLARAHGIRYVDTDDINDAKTVAAIAELEPDYLLVLGWSQLLMGDVLRVPKRYAIGSHPSPLPAGRGRAPIPWTILLGERSGAVSLFRMVIGADAGPLLVQRRFEVPERVTAGELYRLVARELREACRELYRSLAADTVSETVQNEALASYRARRIPADGHIDFGAPRAEVDRLIRAVTRPYPGAYTYLHDQEVRVWASDLGDAPRYAGTRGQILMRRGGRLLVHAGDGPLWLSDLTIDGTPADLADFVVGETFGYRVEDELHRLRNELTGLRARMRD